MKEMKDYNVAEIGECISEDIKKLLTNSLKNQYSLLHINSTFLLKYRPHWIRIEAIFSKI